MQISNIGPDLLELIEKCNLHPGFLRHCVVLLCIFETLCSFIVHFYH